MNVNTIKTSPCVATGILTKKIAYTHKNLYVGKANNILSIRGN